MSKNQKASESESMESNSSISFQEIKSILQEAMLSITGDNSQHWQFRWNNPHLEVFYVPSLGSHEFNNNLHATWISLGTFIEAFQISSRNYNLECLPQLVPQNSPNTPILKISVQKASQEPSPLAAELKRRKTARVPFNTEPIPDRVIEQVKQIANSFPTCRLVFCFKKPLILQNHLIQSDEFLWLNQSALKDFLRWLLLNPNEISQRKRGLPWYTLGIGKIELHLLRLIRLAPIFARIFWFTGMKHKINRQSKILIENQSMIYGIGTSNRTPQALVDVGRLAFRIWLLLTSEGIGVQPLSAASLIGFDITTGHPPPNAPSAEIQRLKNGYDEFSQLLGLSPHEDLVWAFRSGYLKNLEAVPNSPRESIEGLLILNSQNFAEQ